MECQYCQKIFKSKYILQKHITTAKYCIKIQLEKSINKCEYCGQVFMTNILLEEHHQMCASKIKIDIEIKFEREKKEKEDIILKLEKEKEDITSKLEKEKEDIILTLKKEKEDIESKFEKEREYNKIEFQSQIAELQNKLENLAKLAISRPTINTTNKNRIYNNLQPITLDYMKEQGKTLTLEQVSRGLQGIVDHASNSLKDRLTITNLSRNNFKYKDELLDIRTDPNMDYLSGLYFASIKDLVSIHSNELYTSIAMKLGEITNDVINAEDKRIKIMTDGAKVTAFEVDVIHSVAENTDLKKDFVKNMARKVLPAERLTVRNDDIIASRAITPIEPTQIV